MNIGRVRNGAILISVGVVLLLNTTGHLPWEVWLKIFSLWPVALIAIGTELLLKKTRLSFLTVLSPLLFFAAILGPAFIHDSDLGRLSRAGQIYNWSQKLDSTWTTAKVEIRLNSGDMVISSGTDKLISADMDYFETEPLIIYEPSDLDSSVRMKIKDRERKRFEWNLSRGRFWNAWDKKSWEIKLTDQIPIDLLVDVKAGHDDFDLSELKVRVFDLETKASDVEIKMGNLVEEVSARIKSRASRLSILLPEDMALRIKNRTNLSSTSFSWFTLEETEEGYQTPEFDQSSRKLTLYLEGSLTKLKIKRYQPFEGI